MALHQPALHWQMHLIYVYGYTMANASNRSLVGWVPNLLHGIYLLIVFKHWKSAKNEEGNTKMEN
jgi:hypothetical protein